MSILRGLKSRYELHHGVRITDRRSSQRCSWRPLHRRPPAARQGDRSRRRGRLAGTHRDRHKPEALDALSRRVMQLKIEREALSAEPDRASQERLSSSKPSRPTPRRRRRRWRRRGAPRSRAAPRAAGSRRSSTRRRTDLDRAQREGNWSRAGELTYSAHPRRWRSAWPRPRPAPRPSARRSACAMPPRS